MRLSHPAKGVWIEMYLSAVTAMYNFVTPCKGCVDWNYCFPRLRIFRRASHPAKGVWIEIISIKYWRHCFPVTPCKGCVDWNSCRYSRLFCLISHTLQRVCGLKLADQLCKLSDQESHPAKGVWIEIWVPMIQSQRTMVSHPAKGVWIEISVSIDSISIILSHPAKGVWIEIGAENGAFNLDKVTPCKGCVDWNLQMQIVRWKNWSSHPAKGVWIEIPDT